MKEEDDLGPDQREIINSRSFEVYHTWRSIAL